MDSKLQLLGLAHRAKKLVFGEEVLNRISDVKLLIIASDISDASKLRYLRKCEYYHLEYIDKYPYELLSKAVGKNNIRVIGVIDEGFKKSLLEKI